MINKVIDVHHLVGMDDWLSKNKPELEHKNMLEEFYNLNNSSGIKWETHILPFPSSKDGTYKYENKIIKDLSEKNNSLIPEFALNPHLEESYCYVIRSLEKFSKAGIVIWPILCDIDLPDLKNNKYFIEMTKKKNVWITIHVGAGNEKSISRVDKLGRYCPLDALNLAEYFPETRFNLSHLLRLSITALEKVKNFENVVMDTSGLSSHNRWYENEKSIFHANDAGYFIKLNSAQVLKSLVNMGLGKRIVFGTSYPYCNWWNYSIEDELDLILNADISSDEKNNILYNNAMNFY